MRYDTTLKDLFHEPPQRLLQILVGQRGLRMLPLEFSSVMKRIPDLLLELENLSILHMDLQSAPESMDHRMLMYRALIRQHYPGRRLIQKVLYLGADPWRPAAVINEENLHFRYDVIDIRDIDCREMLNSPSLEENILAVLCRLENERATIREILRRIDRMPPKARTDALTRLVILSGLRHLEPLVHEESNDMAITVNVMENTVLRNLFLKAEQKSRQEGLQEGLQKGLQKGFQKGRQEGRQEGKADLLLHLLQRRFGPLPREVTDQVLTADQATLELWSDRVLDVPTLEEVLGGQRIS